MKDKNVNVDLNFSVNGRPSEERILLIDDNRDVATLIEKFLLRKGFSVAAYTEPMLAVAHYSTDSNYDLVLTDTEMSSLSGYQVAHRIKKINPKSKVLLMTSLLEDESEESLQESRADGIIEKPIRLALIADIVQDFIRLSPSAQTVRTRHGR